MKRLTALLLCGLLLLSGCSSQQPQKAKEQSAGTGYGVTQKSAVTLQDLYGLRPGSTRQEVETALGSPHSFIIAENNTETYRLTDGETLVLTYNESDRVTEATYTDNSGRVQDFFGYLNTLGILTNYHPSTDSVPPENTTPAPEETPEELPELDLPVTNIGTAGHFSADRYSYTVAEQILKLGEERETVVSALGKPNGYSSVTFQKDSYLIDVYTMDDGSSLYLDYGYARTKLRAVQMIKGSVASEYLGNWGQEEKPAGYLRYTRNQQVFMNLKKNTKPSEIYRSIGAPDWLEGSATRYRDAYQLLGGDIFYLDFGPNHNSLTAAVLQKADGTIVNYTLR